MGNINRAGSFSLKYEIMESSSSRVCVQESRIVAAMQYEYEYRRVWWLLVQALATKKREKVELHGCLRSVEI